MELFKRYVTLSGGRGVNQCVTYHPFCIIKWTKKCEIGIDSPYAVYLGNLRADFVHRNVDRHSLGHNPRRVNSSLRLLQGPVC